MKQIKAKIDKRLKRLERTPYKQKEKNELRALLVEINNKSFSQNITCFRKKCGTSTKIEQRVLGRRGVLSLKGFQTTKQDSMPIHPRLSPSNIERWK